MRHFRFLSLFLLLICLIPCSFISYAKENSLTTSIDISGKRCLLSGIINDPNSWISDYVPLPSLTSLDVTDFSFSGTYSGSFVQGSSDYYDMSHGYVYFYDSSKKTLGYSDIRCSVSLSGSSFTSHGSGVASVPSGSAYVVFCIKAEPTSKYSLEGGSVSYTADYDVSTNFDVSFPSTLRYSLAGLSLTSDSFSDETLTYLGSFTSDAPFDVSVSGFGDDLGYYDVDCFFDISWAFNAFSMSVSGTDFSSYVYYPNFIVSGLPSGLSYSISYSKQPYTRAYYRSGSTVTNDGPFSATLHIYGTALLSDAFTFNVSSPVLVTLSSYRPIKNNSFTFTSSLSSSSKSGYIVRSSPSSISEIEGLDKIDNTLKDQHDEEVSAADSAGNDLGTTLDSVTGTLSSVEILKLPWTMLSDLLGAVSSDGEKELTFPSFSLMGQTLWPSYTFSLTDLDSNFSVLFESVRLVSGVMLCVAFGSYVRSFFVKIFGKEESEDTV